MKYFIERLEQTLIIPVQTRFIASLHVLIILIILSSCKTSPDLIKTDPLSSDISTTQELSKTQQLLVKEAYRIIGVEELFVKGRTFNIDCSGTVMAIYWYAGIDLAEDFPSYSGGGTERIYKYLRDKDLLYRTELPKPGDIIFWDNTYDKNGNGKPDDYLTHMGMVVSVDDEGNIEYIHENYRKGIILAKMNLYKPDVYTEIIDGEKIILNDPMRMKGSVNSPKWLSSQLYNNFAMGYLLK
ncbi:MAG: C40 family peptidase [Spirochaetaceae bacterium]|nr:C40 family peptidase [Spirochaetaceae bacterium]